ncbi:MAG: MarR family transcriptional regulator [Alphaproteobacteria bacterium]
MRDQPDPRESADRNIGFLIHDVARLMRTVFDRSMRELGLTRSQWWVLTHLYFNEGITQTEFSAILDIERASLGRLLDRLEEKGWLERRPDPSDRRIKRVYLTGEVEPLMRTMRARAAAVRGVAFDGLSTEENDALIGYLDRVKDNLAAELDSQNGTANGAGK